MTQPEAHSFLMKTTFLGGLCLFFCFFKIRKIISKNSWAQWLLPNNTPKEVKGCLLGAIFSYEFAVVEQCISGNNLDEFIAAVDIFMGL